MTPQAKRIDFHHIYHDQKIEDPYHWLRQENWSQEKGVNDPEILKYLKEENTHTQNFFKKHRDKVDKLYQELVEMIDKDDETYPVPRGEYGYYIKTLQGKDYAQHWRIHYKTGKKELILDENALAKDHKYFNLSYLITSNNHQYIAYAIDTDGSERLKLHVVHLKTKEKIIEPLSDVSGNGFVWLKDDSGFYYQKVDNNWRSNRVFFFDLDLDTPYENLIFEENDDTNHVSINDTSDGEFLLINVKSAKDNVIHTQPLNTKTIKLITLLKRKDDIIYSLDSQDDDWILLTNDIGPNKRLLRFKKGQPLIEENSINIFNKNNDQKNLPIVNYDVFKDQVVILCKKDGVPTLFIEHKNQLQHIPFNEESFALHIIGGDYNDVNCQLSLSTLTQPPTTLQVNLKTHEKQILRIKEIPTFDTKNFETKRLTSPSADGTPIPYTIAYKKECSLKNAPVYLYGYGSYGYPIDSDFRTSFIPLLNRGFIVVLAHVRGGSDLGRAWYEAAKLKTKKKTFEDFIACAEGLIEQGYTTKANINIAGGSAGGMLVGAVMNMRPDLFKSVIAMVPFVDVVNTMMDDTLPLTPGEYFEWGNPKEKEYFDYIQSYSPYDNVEKKDYPALYVTAGLNDPRVTYWEPAKWTAKLRHLKTNNNILLLETEMGAGHGGPSGKFDYLKEVAKRYAFILAQYEKQ